MSKGQRLGLIALAFVVMAVAFVIARPDDKSDEPAPQRTVRERAREPTATTDTRPEQRLALRARKPVGGIRRIVTKKGELVRLVVESDAPDEIHLHGYDITREARRSEPARFSFRADIEGVFEVESHEAEHGGGESVIARLVVEPS